MFSRAHTYILSRYACNHTCTGHSTSTYYSVLSKRAWTLRYSMAYNSWLNNCQFCLCVIMNWSASDV